MWGSIEYSLMIISKQMCKLTLEGVVRYGHSKLALKISVPLYKVKFWPSPRSGKSLITFYTLVMEPNTMLGSIEYRLMTNDKQVWSPQSEAVVVICGYYKFWLKILAVPLVKVKLGVSPSLGKSLITFYSLVITPTTMLGSIEYRSMMNDKQMW